MLKSIGHAIEYVPNRYVEPGMLYAVVKRRYDDSPVWHGRLPYTPIREFKFGGGAWPRSDAP